MSAEATTAIDPRALRSAFGAFPTGVTVVTTHDAASQPIGFTANSFTSVSIDPPLLLVCLARTSRNFGTFTQAKRFAINVLSEGQTDISNTFARPVEDRFANLSWRRGPFGSPLIDDTAAWFDCATHDVLDGGDHVILVGRIEAFAGSDANSLGYSRGGYFTPSLIKKAVSAAASESEVMVSAVVERDGSLLLDVRPDGSLALPTCTMRTDEGPEVLEALVASETGLTASVGYIYSVYQDRRSGAQHIVYRCGLGPGAPKAGHLFDLGTLPFGRIRDAATVDIVKRFAAESQLGNFGVYVGDERTGKVHPLSRKA